MEVLSCICVSNVVKGFGKHQVWLIKQQKCFVICIVQIPANIDAKNVCIQKKLFQQRSKMQRNQILGQTFSKVINRDTTGLCLLQSPFCSMSFDHKYLVQLIKEPILRILNFNFPNLRCCNAFFSF